MELSYKNQMIILLAWIPVVMIIFKVIPDRQIASLAAGVGFIIIPGYLFNNEFKKKEEDKIYLISLGLFLICFAVPIFLLRLLNWGIDFTTLAIFGIQATKLHTISGFAYILVIGAVIRQYIHEIGGV